MSEPSLKTSRDFLDFQAEYEGSISLHPLHRSKFIQGIPDIVLQGSAPQAPVVADTNTL